MDNAGYATLTRQSGLMQELQLVANNIANANTTGFRAEGVMFSEFVADLGRDTSSLSMAAARIKLTDMTQGTLAQTGGSFDLAIEGDGYFLVGTPDGPRLTRAGSFTPNADGELATMDGNPVLDAGGAPVFVPAGDGPVGIAADGTLSAGGVAVGQIGIVVPTDPTAMRRQSGTLFAADAGFEPAPSGRVLQGFLEDSNVNPIVQISRMIELQRAYELGASFLETEDTRIRGVIQAIGR
ncbi:flagellar basal-body rod protein FlgF [Loktanella fryxellensis]|uniref:Flagellar basal-body rod protein FlgF n=1 Tax=Loktanella fryxellensis TaxID=245187 RepID=A0A1H7ZQR7_9RHOB|nr:flagellar hook-basal body complex protein [Loktanella fryxellensis]SEM60633.1 flagellar basal-body rod protein FlgF [Loktanella fryxellensis]